MKLIVFLGNIGKKYESTRHNAGFLFGEYLRKEWGFPEWEDQPKFFGEISEGTHHDEKFIFLRPSTFMNLSGKSVSAVQKFYKIPLKNILLCHDDKDIPFGTVRYREKGSSGGQKGVEDVIRVFGTKEIQRMKIGIANEEIGKFTETADFVLSRFSESEIEKLPEIFEEAGKLLRINS
ncbi:aminoacyl-tRNA hydrolase [Candidatus Peregrinibacteria bacterium]|nr:aminoacyl-tRNA hydrolase [Candidatus Peregrinibacteria bacterium]